MKKLIFLEVKKPYFIIVVLSVVLATLLAPAIAAELEPANQTAVAWIDAHKDEITSVSRQIWEYAELGLMEFKSSKLLADQLRKAGFKVEMGVAGMPTAFVATVGSGRPVIGILAEYDALPDIVKTSEPVAPKLVVGATAHGCGHNLLGEGSVAAGIAIKEAIVRHRLGGTIKVFGTPAEEEYLGKVYMAREGLFDGLDAVLTWHPTGIWDAGWGTHMALNSTKFIFRGRSAHGGNFPWGGRNALNAVELTNAAVNAMRQQIYQIDRATIQYSVSYGGLNPAVIPPIAEVRYMVHGPNRERVEEIYNKVVNAARAAALATETELEIQFIVGTYQTLGNESLARFGSKNLQLFAPVKFTPEELEFARKIQATYTYQKKQPKVMWDVILPFSGTGVGGHATDVGDVSWIAPLISVLGATDPMGMTAHSWGKTAIVGMSIGEKVMMAVAKTLAATGIDLLTKPDEMQKVTKEFQEKTRGFVYKANIPAGPPPHPSILHGYWIK